MEAITKTKKPTGASITKKRRVSQTHSPKSLFRKEAEQFLDSMTPNQQRRVVSAYLDSWAKYPDYVGLSSYKISYWKNVATQGTDKEFLEVLREVKKHILSSEWSQNKALKQLYALAAKQKLAGGEETEAPAQHVRGPIKSALKMMKALLAMQQEVSDMQHAVDRQLLSGEQIEAVAVAVPPSPLTEGAARGALTLQEGARRLPSALLPAFAVEGEIPSPEMPPAIEGMTLSNKGAPSEEDTLPLEEQEKLVLPPTPQTSVWGASPGAEQGEEAEEIEQLSSSPSLSPTLSDVPPSPSETKANLYYYYY